MRSISIARRKQKGGSTTTRKGWRQSYRKERDGSIVPVDRVSSSFLLNKKKGGKRKDEEDVEEEEEEKTIDKRSRKRNWSNLDIPSGFSSGVEIKLAFSCSFSLFYFFCKGWGRRNWVHVFLFLFPFCATHRHTHRQVQLAEKLQQAERNMKQ